MRLSLLTFLCLIQVAVLQACVAADPNTASSPSALQTQESDVLVIEAPTIEKVDSVIRAQGGVLLRRGNRAIWASSAEYDLEAGTGTLRDAVFTTCSLDNPDYRIESGEVTLLSNERLRVKRASVFMGRRKVLTLPTLKFRVGSRASSAVVFPRLGYGDLDGLSLSQTLVFVESDRLKTSADVRLTSRNGVQGEAIAEYGMDGALLDFPGRLFDYESMRSRAVDPPHETLQPRDPFSLYPSGAARLCLRASLSRRQRVFDIDNEDLTLNRTPEIGLSYTGSQISFSKQPLDPRLEIYPQAIVTWGRYEEKPASVPTTSRRRLMVVAPVNLLDLGPRTSVQPVGSYSVSSYGGGGSYRAWSYALDASHMFTNGSYASLRFIRRGESGATPFEFDDIDIRREIQAAGQAHIRGRHVIGLALNYDVDDERLYEWEVLYAHRTDCLMRALRWNSRLRRLSVDIDLINL